MATSLSLFLKVSNRWPTVWSSEIYFALSHGRLHCSWWINGGSAVSQFSWRTERIFFGRNHETLRIQGWSEADTGLYLDPRAPWAFPFPFRRKNDAGSFALPRDANFSNVETFHVNLLLAPQRACPSLPTAWNNIKLFVSRPRYHRPLSLSLSLSILPRWRRSGLLLLNHSARCPLHYSTAKTSRCGFLEDPRFSPRICVTGPYLRRRQLAKKHAFNNSRPIPVS